MRWTVRVLIADLSAGWIAPLSVSHWLFSGMLSEAIIPAIRERKVWVGSFKPVPYIDGMFYFSMIWLTGTIVVWVIYLTSQKNR